MIEPNALVEGDCLAVMRDIADKSCDMICADLPYQMLNKNNPSAAWDRMIPFEPLWEQYLRIIKDDGAIVLFGSGMFTAQLMMSQPKLWRYNLIWDKCRATGFLNAKRMPLRYHEDICVFYKKLPTYNPQMRHCEPHRRNHSRGKQEGQTNRCYGKFGKAEDIITDYKYPRSIIAIPKAHKKEEWYHPVEKPVELLRYLIRTYTNEGELVLDSCAGSGSTCVAAVLESRRYIGIELAKEYYDVAVKRVRAVAGLPSLF